MLGEFIKSLKYSRQTSHLSRHIVLALLLINNGFFNNLADEKSRHYMLATSMSWLGIYLVLVNQFKQTQCVRYFIKMH